MRSGLQRREPEGEEGRREDEVGDAREEVSLALSVMSSREYVSQDSINLSTSSLFKDGGDFPSRRCLDEWLVKIRIRFLLLSSSSSSSPSHSLSPSPRLPRARTAQAPSSWLRPPSLFTR